MVDTSIVSIRGIREEDIEQLAAGLGLARHQIDQRWQQQIAGWREVFVADSAGRAVGTVSINERPERPDMLHLFALDVAEPARNQGIGSQLVAFVEAQARRRELRGVYLEVAVTNINAKRLYERLAYEQDGLPFQNSWNSYREDGTVEEKVELMVRLLKVF